MIREKGAQFLLRRKMRKLGYKMVASPFHQNAELESNIYLKAKDIACFQHFLHQIDIGNEAISYGQRRYALYKGIQYELGRIFSSGCCNIMDMVIPGISKFSNLHAILWQLYDI